MAGLLPLLQITPEENRLAVARPVCGANLHVLRLSRQYAPVRAVGPGDRELVSTRLRVTRVGDPPSLRRPRDAHAVGVQRQQVELSLAAPVRSNDRDSAIGPREGQLSPRW